jgi:hypothetical protein
MATKKFLIEVEEGGTLCNECPFRASKCNTDALNAINCNEFNLSTMKIKEYNEPNCYNLQCLDRNPNELEYEDKD